MATYAIPELETPTRVAAEEVLLVASGDLRQSAKRSAGRPRRRWKSKLTEAFAAEGFTLRRAHPFDPDLGHGFIYNQRMGMDVFMNDPSRRADHRCRGGLAVQPQRLLRTAASPRPHSHRGQLVGPVAGPGGHAQPEWLSAQGGSRFSTLWSKDFDDDSSATGCGNGCATPRHHDQSHVHRPRSLRRCRRRENWARRWPAISRRARRSLASSTKAAWACTTPSSKTIC